MREVRQEASGRAQGGRQRRTEAGMVSQTAHRKLTSARTTKGAPLRKAQSPS